MHPHPQTISSYFSLPSLEVTCMINNRKIKCSPPSPAPGHHRQPSPPCASVKPVFLPGNSGCRPPPNHPSWAIADNSPLTEPLCIFPSKYGFPLLWNLRVICLYSHLSILCLMKYFILFFYKPYTRWYITKGQPFWMLPSPWVMSEDPHEVLCSINNDGSSLFQSPRKGSTLVGNW